VEAVCSKLTRHVQMKVAESGGKLFFTVSGFVHNDISISFSIDLLVGPVSLNGYFLSQTNLLLL